MAQVSITINGRPHTVGCADGQEPRLRDLAAVLDNEVTTLVDAVGQVGESRLLVIAGLALVDRLSEQVAAADNAVQDQATTASAQLQAQQARIAELEAQLQATALRIDTIAATLEGA